MEKNEAYGIFGYMTSEVLLVWQRYELGMLIQILM